jgi:hypothetical protein
LKDGAIVSVDELKQVGALIDVIIIKEVCVKIEVSLESNLPEEILPEESLPRTTSQIRRSDNGWFSHDVIMVAGHPASSRCEISPRFSSGGI